MDRGKALSKAARVDVHHPVRVACELHLMGDEDTGAAGEGGADATVEQVRRDWGINGGQRIVQQVDGPLTVHRPPQRHPCFLAFGESGAGFADQGAMTQGELTNVSRQRTALDHRPVPVRQIRRTEEDGVHQTLARQPRLLCSVGDGATEEDLALGLDQLAQQPLRPHDTLRIMMGMMESGCERGRG